MNMYSIKNCGANEFFTPFLAKTDVMAEYEVSKYYEKQDDIPFNLELYRVGTFDTNDAEITSYEIQLIHTFVKKKKNNKDK